MPSSIMVLSDTAASLRVFGELFTDAGYDVLLRTHGARDVAEIARWQPDLVISDHIPSQEHRDWQFVHTLKMTPETVHIPIIICTTDATWLQGQEPWLSSKGVLIVLKPFVSNDLLHAAMHQIESADA